MATIPTMRVSEHDLRALLEEVEHLRAQRDDLQHRNGQLLERARKAECSLLQLSTTKVSEDEDDEG